MIIKNKVVFIHDIEIFPNLFIDGVLNTETNEIITFEVSKRKNNIEDLINFYSNCKDKIICGYNNIHYDDPIINLLLDKKEQVINSYAAKICDVLYSFSKLIIEGDDISKWSKWKYARNFDTLDLLTMLFSQKLRVGLKEMQVTMCFNNVQEYDGDFSKYCPIEDIDKVISYNNNDLLSTKELLYKCKSQIDLRIGIEEEFGVDVLSKDGVSIGMEILKIKYLQKTGKQWWQIKDLRTPCDIIDLNQVILPFIKFDTPILQDLLRELKQQKVSPGRKGYEKHFLLDGVEITVGVGGIHTRNDPEKIIPNENEVLLDSDVALAKEAQVKFLKLRELPQRFSYQSVIILNIG